jgi:hypothetical protein
MCTTWADGRPGCKGLKSFRFSWLHRLPNVKNAMLLYFGAQTPACGAGRLAIMVRFPFGRLSP